MPKGTKVESVYQALKEKGMSSEQAARIAQSQTNQSLATGKPLPEKKTEEKKKP